MLSEMLFTNGQIVQKGDPLFVIDTCPFEIKLQQAIAAVQSAQDRLGLTKVEPSRAERLKKRRLALRKRSINARRMKTPQRWRSRRQSALDARLDLEVAHVSAPFTGRMSNHLVSVGTLGHVLRTLEWRC